MILGIVFLSASNGVVDTLRHVAFFGGDLDPPGGGGGLVVEPGHR